jgi:hypothetical protein
MYNRDDPDMPQEVVRFPMGSERINELMPPTLEAICTSNALQRRINDVRFLTTLSGGAASWKMRRAGLPWDRAPSARLVAPRAQAAPAKRRAHPQQRGSVPQARPPASAAGQG